MTDWHVWHEQYDDPGSSLSRRLEVVRRLLTGIVEPMSGDDRVLSLCAGDGRDVIPVVAGLPALRRPELVLVELDEQLASAARENAQDAGVAATVIAADAGDTSLWRQHLPVNLLMLCGIFGNISDDDIRSTIEAAPAMLPKGGTVIWTRGARRERDLRPQVRQWFNEAGFTEVHFESEPGGFGVGVNRSPDAAAPRAIPDQLFTFIR
ncbi:MAG TPA: class I SAM-dependent methyltransferase [Mycobacteriales bacterium]|nr:class I SAM-dependent methyltransferase [Mycobacteriales bacterium]